MIRRLSLLLIFLSMPLAASSPSATESTSPPDSTLSSFSLFPFAFSTPETGLGGGGGLVHTRRVTGDSTLTRSNSIQFFGFYTAKNQSAAILSSEFYLAEQKLLFESVVKFGKMPSLYYGIGNKTELTAEEEYTQESTALQLTPRYRIVPGLRLGATLILRKDNLYAMKSDGLLATRRPDGFAAGVSNAWGPLLSWDTRDNTYYPHGGHYCAIETRFFGTALNSDYTFTRYEADLRKYIQLWPDHYLALQGYLSAFDGNVPFYDLAQLGNILRGIYQSRFSDRALTAAQMEYRFPLPLWYDWLADFRGSLFVGTGQVAPKLSQMTGKALKTTAGCGLRYALDRRERIHLRFDIGVGSDGAEIYFQFMEAF